VAGGQAVTDGWALMQAALRTWGRWGPHPFASGVEQRTWWIGVAAVVVELRYKEGDFLPLHRDKASVLGQIHVVVSEQSDADFLRVDAEETVRWWRCPSPLGEDRQIEVLVFRPDRHAHHVLPCIEPRRSIIFGLTIFDKGLVSRVAERCGVS